MNERTKLINLLLSLGFEVVGHGSTIDRITEHMNFSNGDIRVNLTNDNEHVYIIRSAKVYIVGGYDGCERYHPVSISDDMKHALEPYLLPKESIVEDISNWRYEPYHKRMLEEIREHNKWCKENGLIDNMIPESRA